MADVLIIDDDPQIGSLLARRFQQMEHRAFVAATLEEGLRVLFDGNFDVVFLDVNLPDGNGLDAIEGIREHGNAPEIIIMTGVSDPEGAELAMKSRAWDYILKSGSTRQFQFSLARALEYRQQKESNQNPKSRLSGRSIVGESREIKTCLDTVLKLSRSEAPVLITGETGTGKELFARAIHENSSRKDRDMIVVDSTVLPDHLVESVLFGHTRGAFTSADADRTGLLRLADGGTLLLDEVGELPLEIQKKFLRALQEKRFRPVGGRREEPSDFRLIAATHQDLAAMVAEGRFRGDLYFRIAALTIHIPALRERKSDIPFLVSHHMNRKKNVFNDPVCDVSREFLDELFYYDWPGNVRELFNVIDAACSEAFGEPVLYPKHLPVQVRTVNIKKKISECDRILLENPGADGRIPVERFSLKAFLDTMRGRYVRSLMTHVNADVPSACRLSGLSRGHLYTLLKKYGVSTE